MSGTWQEKYFEMLGEKQRLEFTKLRAENERLRKALETIANWPHNVCAGDAHCFAATALEEKNDLKVAEMHIKTLRDRIRDLEEEPKNPIRKMGILLLKGDLAAWKPVEIFFSTDEDPNNTKKAAEISRRFAWRVGAHAGEMDHVSLINIPVSELDFFMAQDDGIVFEGKEPGSNE